MYAEDLKNAVCPVCKYNFCCTCFKASHNEDCNLLEALEEAQKNGMDIRKCPNCQIWMTKDEQCDHVTCFNCKKDWQFCCSVMRNPTLKHSNYYHRNDCDYYSADNQGLAFNNDCEACSKKGSLCDAPQGSKDEVNKKNCPGCKSNQREDQFYQTHQSASQIMYLKDVSFHIDCQKCQKQAYQDVMLHNQAYAEENPNEQKQTCAKCNKEKHSKLFFNLYCCNTWCCQDCAHEFVKENLQQQKFGEKDLACFKCQVPLNKKVLESVTTQEIIDQIQNWRANNK